MCIAFIYLDFPELKPLTGRSRCTRRKARGNSPKHQESSHDTEASGRAGESFAYIYIVISKICMHGVLYLGKVHKMLY